MRYAAIRTMDVSNGSGLGISLFTQGCRNHCPHCHNPEQWTFEGGNEFGSEQRDEIVTLCQKEWVKRFSVLGGEPLEPENHEALLDLLRAVKRNAPHVEVWLYTGLVYEDLVLGTSRVDSPWLQSILGAVDVLVDGPFIEAQRNIALRFRGSENQRIIDMNKTRAARGTIVLWKDDPLFGEHEAEQLAKIHTHVSA